MRALCNSDWDRRSALLDWESDQKQSRKDKSIFWDTYAVTRRAAEQGVMQKNV